MLFQILFTMYYTGKLPNCHNELKFWIKLQLVENVLYWIYKYIMRMIL